MSRYRSSLQNGSVADKLSVTDRHAFMQISCNLAHQTAVKLFSPYGAFEKTNWTNVACYDINIM